MLADAKAALARGRPVVLVRPPAVDRASELWELISPAAPGPAPGPRVLIVCADDAAASEWAGATPPERRVHAVTGLTRSGRILREQAIDVLAGAPKDLAALLERAALKLEHVTTVVVAWPEALVVSEAAAPLDTLLAEAAEAHRIVLTWQLGALGDFLERHARRALVLGAAADDAGAVPPVGQVRYCIVASERRSVALRDALDALGATRPFTWDGGPIPLPTPPPGGPDAVLCTRLPTREELAALARLGAPVVFLRSSQLAYLRSVATATPLPLPSLADRARDRAEALRERVAQRLAGASVDAELALLDPLFDRFDAAEVAAALLALLGGGGAERADPSVAEPVVQAPVRVFVNVGKRDRAAAKDFVGALIREVGLAKGDIGRIEVREAFSLIEVAPGVATEAARRLTGTTIRGRRVLARLDRGA